METLRYLCIILLLGLFVSCHGQNRIVEVNTGQGQAEDNGNQTIDSVETDTSTTPAPAVSFIDTFLTESPIDLNGIDATFAENIPYGLFKDNTFDIFLPTVDTPTPLVIYIHGGGFTGGDKGMVYSNDSSRDYPQEIRTFLSHNIAYATINYRLLKNVDKQGVIKSLSDSKRALQYIRFISDKLNINPQRIALSGSSAGGGTAEWLAFSDDMADPDNPDSVLRQSTRVKGLAVRSTQASYDLKRYETDIFADYNFNLQKFLMANSAFKQRFESFYGISELAQFYSDSITAYRKRIDMLGLISSDDPPIWAQNSLPVKKPTTLNILNHHPYHVREIKERADSVGIRNVMYFADYADSSGESLTQFLLRILGKNR